MRPLKVPITLMIIDNSNTFLCKVCNFFVKAHYWARCLWITMSISNHRLLNHKDILKDKFKEIYPLWPWSPWASHVYLNIMFVNSKWTIWYPKIILNSLWSSTNKEFSNCMETILTIGEVLEVNEPRDTFAWAIKMVLWKAFKNRNGWMDLGKPMPMRRNS